VCQIVSDKRDWSFISELKDNFLPPPKLGPGTTSFIAQMWFLRQLALKDNIVSRKGNYISDRSQTSVYIYSKENLNEYEFEIFKALLHQLDMKRPEIEIIMHCSDDVIMDRINSRGRQNKANWGEDDIEYLKRINAAFKKHYEDYRDVKKIYLVDASGTLEENLAKVEEIIRKNVKH